MQPKYLRTPYRIFWVRLGFMIICHSGLLPTLYNCQVLDDQNFRRRFRVSNYRTTTRVNPFVCTMPIRLEVGWNQIQFNLSDLTRRAYGTRYIETLRVQVNSLRCKNVLAKYFWKFQIFYIWFFFSSFQIHANCRIRRVYFTDRLYSEDELPAEFKLYLPIQNQKNKVRHTPTADLPAHA